MVADLYLENWDLPDRIWQGLCCDNMEASLPDGASFSFVASGRSDQGELAPVSERHDEALAQASAATAS